MQGHAIVCDVPIAQPHIIMYSILLISLPHTTQMGLDMYEQTHIENPGAQFFLLCLPRLTLPLWAT